MIIMCQITFKIYMTFKHHSLNLPLPMSVGFGSKCTPVAFRNKHTASQGTNIVIQFQHHVLFKGRAEQCDIHSVHLKTQHFYLHFFFQVNSKYYWNDFIGVFFFLLIKSITAEFCRSLEAMRNFGEKNGKIIIFSNNIFLNEFSHISIDTWSS